ncbi:hypothetical protein A2334_00900 [Candidatus Roizmanbacteria bacterium RIFOXYB2_FULL_38_10]|uniref:Glutaredoxin domain-containing protein n=1 Tax=Candidatus Roizmanbacteria bacterium RIFOXYD1_FULL_38_12 TaxID=1802093 RepID=A0A1F7L1G7_9BACT|nr:MAG: hypothetical protein A3K47_04195 [Candidatus Roizmanbacteria bacterium RIFOXYA2_FULL_38_14]OGK63958.1 MAG: hypothetical protein A3K27_04195 [Candidatus Roizmanbacteria bacterium RIFOXYA1_FULL_37_12]OGK65804.1 MAG: hypothetical protein A3K38_04195 [Candidatus Roizmanbacteria bacterium RIFOXYB1_FULL_40_23]OGK68912.1 MAG: hypothetical protein A2334_00900 [Candidatus Roizmanbacteria bacterium RIFOXYB2_FULL_38_10]OGK70209.1 MAG: hypothetical protein A3K21_04200 [Candidatus Roizmanbacteria ba
MKITIYTITDCQFSKQEKEYLTSHQLPFDEKNLETNREFLTEMLAVSNNFAGTPVTKIDKDDGQIAVLRGFTKEEFDKVLGLTPQAVPEPVKPASEPTLPTPTPPAEPSVPQTQPTEQPTQPQQSPDPMANVLNNLAQQASGTSPLPATPPAPAMPNIPDPKL